MGIKGFFWWKGCGPEAAGTLGRASCGFPSLWSCIFISECWTWGTWGGQYYKEIFLFFFLSLSHFVYQYFLIRNAYLFKFSGRYFRHNFFTFSLSSVLENDSDGAVGWEPSCHQHLWLWSSYFLWDCWKERVGGSSLRSFGFRIKLYFIGLWSMFFVPTISNFFVFKTLSIYCTFKTNTFFT